MHILRTRHDKGFTLVEIAIALVVVALLAAGAISALKVQVAYTRTSEAREQIREARQAIVNYAIANQGLPCTVVNTSGQQASSPPCLNNTLKGYLPWKDLGLPSKDPWGQTLRYAVSSLMTVPGTLKYSTPGELTVMSGSTTIDNKNAIAFVVWSTGEDAIDSSASAASDTVIAEAPGSDDIVEWTSRYVVFGQMSTAGRVLPLN